MLVLTRKVGQQIVLPENGVTIDVVNIGKRQVRLGIVAPSATPVQRKEVWDRFHPEKDSLPQSNGRLPAQAMSPHGETDGANSVSTTTRPTDIGLCLAHWIARRTGGRVWRLTVTIDEDRLIISGSAPSYYIRQLVQAAATEMLSTCNGAVPSEIEYRIEVEDAS